MISLYKNLEAELARRKLSRTMIAHELGITIGTLCLKLNGKANLTLPEAKKIKNYLKCDMSIDELFDDEQHFEDASGTNAEPEPTEEEGGE